MKTLNGQEFSTLEHFQKLAVDSLMLDVVSHGGNKNNGAPTDHAEIKSYLQANITELDGVVNALVNNALREWDS
jgi:hypothetical protein